MPKQFFAQFGCDFLKSLLIISFHKNLWQMEELSSISTSNQHTPDQIIDALLGYKDKDRIRLIDKFDITYLVLELNRVKLEKVESLYKMKPSGLDVLEFTRLFVNFIEHSTNQTVYVVVAILELFQEVCAMHNVKLVKFHHLTNYFCQRIFEDKSEICPVKTRLLPCYKNVDPAAKVSTVEVEAPVIYGQTQQCIVKLSQNKKWRTDRYKHYGLIKCAAYDKASKNLLCLDHLADYIGVYDMDCVLLKKIQPSCNAFRKDINILSFAYSQRQERIGAVLKDYSLVFWDLRGKADSEKMFSITEHCADYQCNIWYLQRHDLWVTGDKNGKLYTWDLNDEKPLKVITLKLQTKVTDLCELPCLNLVALSQEHRIQQQQRKKSNRYDRLPEEMKQKQSLSSELYRVMLYNIRQGSRVSQISLSHRAIHTLHYSSTYQVLLSCGYQTKIDILQVNPRFFDISVKASLVGHQTMITTFTPIENTPMIISADDKGKIKLWDIRSCKCIQTVELGDHIQVSRLITMLDIGKLGMVGLRINILDFERRAFDQRACTKQKAAQYPIKVEFDPNVNELVVFTKKDVRFYDLLTGTIKFIYSGYFEQDQQIISAKYIPSQRQYSLCNDRGQIKLFSAFNGQFICNMLPHTSQVSGIRYDCLNRLFITSSWDSNILIQKQNAHGNFVEMRKLSDNFNKKEITIMDVSVYHNIIAIGCSAEGLVYFWDYQMGKLLNGINFGHDQQPTSFAFINGYATIVIGTGKGRVYLIKFNRKQMALNLELVTLVAVAKGGIVFPIAVDTRIATNGDKAKQKLVLCDVIVGTSKGQVCELDVTYIFQDQQIIPHSSTRINYNAEVVLKQNFVAQSSKKIFKAFTFSSENKPHFELPSQKIIRFQAHNTAMTDITLVQSRDNKFRVTAGHDSRVKFWTKGGILIADFNVNMPLPYRWELPAKTTLRKRDKIILALKVIRSLAIKFSNSMSRSEQEVLGVDAFLSSLKPTKNPPPSPKKKPARLLQDELSRKDLHYDSIKRNNFKEIAGLSLKEMGFEKRIRIIQKSLKSQEKDMEEHQKLIEEAQARNYRAQERTELMNLLYRKSEASTHTDALTINIKEIFKEFESNRQNQLQQTKENSVITKMQIEIGTRQKKKNKPYTPFERYYFQRRGQQTEKCLTKDHYSVQTPKHKKRVFEKILQNLNRQLDSSKKSHKNLSNHELTKSFRPSQRESIRNQFFTTQPSFDITPIKLSPKRSRI